MIMAQILCERVLQYEDEGECVQVYLYIPEQVAAEEWKCAFEISGGPFGSRMEKAYGIDAMDALYNALEGIRAVLAEGPSEGLTWHNGTIPGHGFRRLVPAFLGPELEKTVGSLIDNLIGYTSTILERQHGRNMQDK